MQTLYFTPNKLLKHAITGTLYFSVAVEDKNTFFTIFQK